MSVSACARPSFRDQAWACPLPPPPVAAANASLVLPAPSPSSAVAARSVTATTAWAPRTPLHRLRLSRRCVRPLRAVPSRLLPRLRRRHAALPHVSMEGLTGLCMVDSRVRPMFCLAWCSRWCVCHAAPQAGVAFDAAALVRAACAALANPLPLCRFPSPTAAPIQLSAPPVFLPRVPVNCRTAAALSAAAAGRQSPSWSASRLLQASSSRPSRCRCAWGFAFSGGVYGCSCLLLRCRWLRGEVARGCMHGRSIRSCRAVLPRVLG